MKKRSTAVFIILSVLLSAVAAAAEPMTDISDNPHRNSIEQMVDLEVLSGRGDGLFCPDDNLTRAEAAKVAVFLAGFDQEDAMQAVALPQAFDDVYAGMGAHEWALGWVNLAAGEGIIGGYGDGKYYPGDNLQMVQWAAILIRILGYETEGLEWPAGYDQLAGELGLTEGLEYISDSYIRRDQMARFTANAVYNVERPDGSAIIDLLEGTAADTPGDTEDEPGDTEDQPVEGIALSLEAAPEVIPEGGGQTVTIKVSVADNGGNPVEGAVVSFHAAAFESGERNAQLSQPQVTTDASGKASATYTTLAADDKRMVEINIAAGKDSAMEHQNLKIMAASQAAAVTGVVRDPYTGVPVEGVHIHFMSSQTNRSIGFVETDSQGGYLMIVPTGTYNMTFEMAIRDQITVNAKTSGKTYTIDYNKGILKGVVTGVSPGSIVMAIGPGFNRNSPDNWTLQAETQSDGSFTLVLSPNTYELYITGRTTAFKTGVVVQSGRVTDLGTISAK